MRAGDKVRYMGTSQPELSGMDGTVVEVTQDSALVQFRGRIEGCSRHELVVVLSREAEAFRKRKATWYGK